MSETMEGGCACGRIRFSAEVTNDDAYLCHCRMCQRASGNVSLALKTMPQADISWATEPDWYDSSPIARRPFCSACGTSLGFMYREGTDQMDLTIAAFDDPWRFQPKFHFGQETMHRAWLNTEGLPEHKITDNPRTVERWMSKVGKLPD